MTLMLTFENHCPRIRERARMAGGRGGAIRSLMKPLLSEGETISPVLDSD